MSEYTMAVFGTLEQGEADFQRTYSSLQSEVSSLESQLRSSLSRWDGAAQQAYYQAQAQWNAAMANMAQVLSQLGARDRHGELQLHERRVAEHRAVERLIARSGTWAGTGRAWRARSRPRPVREVREDGHER